MNPNHRSGLQLNKWIKMHLNNLFEYENTLHAKRITSRIVLISFVDQNGVYATTSPSLIVISIHGKFLFFIRKHTAIVNSES